MSSTRYQDRYTSMANSSNWRSVPKQQYHSKQNISTKKITTKSKVIDIISRDPTDIPAIVKGLERLAENNENSLCDVIVSFHLHEAMISEKIRKILVSSHKVDKHTLIHWVNWPGYNHQKTPRFSRSLEDVIETIKILFSLGYSPLERNSHNETAIGSLRKAYQDNRFSQNDYEILLHLYSHPPENIIEQMIIMTLNKLTKQTSKKQGSALRWLMSLNPLLFSKEVIRLCLKYDHRIMREHGVYSCIRSFIDLIKEIFTKNKCSNDDDFREYFDEHGWESDEQIALFNMYITQEIMNYNINSIDRETKSPVMLGALLGECGNIQSIVEFIKIMLTNKNNENNYLIGLICFAHTKVDIKDTISKYIDDIYETSSSFIKFVIDDIYNKSISNKNIVQNKNVVKITKQKDKTTSQFLNIYATKTTYFNKLNILISGLKQCETYKIIQVDKSDQDIVPVFSPSCIDDIAYTLYDILKSSKSDEFTILTAYIVQLMCVILEQHQITAGFNILDSFLKFDIIKNENIKLAMNLITNEKSIIIDHISNIYDISLSLVELNYSKIMKAIEETQLI